MIVVTGAAGFIGSCMVAKLNAEGFKDLVLVDEFSNPAKAPNYKQKKYTLLVEREEFMGWLAQHEQQVQAVLHLGARTDTTEPRKDIFDHLNLEYSQQVWQACTSYQIPLLYASSAATYGKGEHGFSDDVETLPLLKPQNEYAASKHAFDLWVMAQERKPFFWAGFKFFNVYGPNEYHKGRMASVIYHAYHQIKAGGSLKLFKSHRPDYVDGGQQRDFIYVMDVVEVLFFMLTQRKHSGLYNLGSGTARSFTHLGASTFGALGMPPNIEYVPMPEDLRAGYQYYTQAEMHKLRAAGYDRPFTSLEAGVQDYIERFLVPEAFF